MATKKITGQSKLAQTTESKADSKERLDLVTPSKKSIIEGIPTL